MAADKVKSIAYAATYIDNWINQKRFFGILDRSQKENANLYIFNTHYLNDSNGYDRQSNVLLNFITAQQFDGAIIGNLVKEDIISDEDSCQFFKRFSMPVVSIRENSGKVPYIAADNYGGMKAMIRHLVEVHNAKRIVYVRGPHTHPYAEERQRAFLDTLIEAGLSTAKNMITPPSNWEQSKLEVILDERKLVPGRDFDAVVCANDILAAEVMKILQSRGFSIPKDVMVTGFNNTAECSVLTPTLSSVDISFYDQGNEACQLLLSMIQSPDGKPDVYIKLPPAMIAIRDSCGCIAPAYKDMDISFRDDEVLKSSEIQERILKIFSQVFSEEKIVENDLRALADWFTACCVEEKNSDEYFAVFQQVLNNRVIAGESVSHWNNLCTRLRQNIIPVFSQKAEVIRVETLFHKMRMYIFKTCMRLEQASALQRKKLNDTIRELGNALISTFDIREIMNELSAGIAGLNIDTCYVSLYDNPQKPADFSRLILAVRNNERLEIEPDGLLYPSKDIVPKDYRPIKEPYCIIVSALFFQNRQIGFICFRMNRKDTVVYDMVREQLNASLQIALSIRDLEIMQKNIALQTDELARSNSELEQFAYVTSHDLQEPLRKIIAMSDRIMGMKEQTLNININDYLERMHRAAYRMHHLIEDLLAYSRVSIKPRPFEKVNLKEICNQVMSDLEIRIRQTNTTINIGDLPVIDAEPVQMRQLFQNILGNAIKFQRKGIPPVITVESINDGNGVYEIRVTDNGIGIKKEYFNKIFGIFERLHTTAEYEGSGIGLAICKKIIEQHRGSIIIDSDSGHGTTFVIKLPSKKM